MLYFLNKDTDFPKNFKILSAYPKDTSKFFGHNHHNDVILFYQKALKEKGVNINLVYSPLGISKNDTIVFALQSQADTLHKYFTLSYIDSTNRGSYCVIESVR